ncbi:cuticle protein AM1199-like [Penaeus monodon]|uniref:cuticle protein AM1199-like n=1 Tax=Penaeus monodon TaxID=6687 RepID=UPI0018A7A79D|nr:cuticle protein AM1199-like [Penaeus monodon]
MQFLVAAAVLAMVAAAPQNGNQLDYQARPYYRPLATLRNHRQDLGDGNFNYEFLTENGIHVRAQGTPGYRGQSNINGFYSYPLTDGSYAEVRYVADELGYRADSRLIPSRRYRLDRHLLPFRLAEAQRRLQGTRTAF